MLYVPLFLRCSCTGLRWSGAQPDNVPARQAPQAAGTFTQRICSRSNAKQEQPRGAEAWFRPAECNLVVVRVTMKTKRKGWVGGESRINLEPKWHKINTRPTRPTSSIIVTLLATTIRFQNNNVTLVATAETRTSGLLLFSCS